MNLSFEITFGHHPVGRFIPRDLALWESDKKTIFSLFQKLLNHKTSLDDFLSQCRILLDKDGSQLYALNFLMDSVTFLEKSEDLNLKEYLDNFFLPILKLIPPSFKGTLDTENDIVKIFLESHRKFILSYLRDNDYEQVLKNGLIHVKWDQEDSFGVGSLIVNLYLIQNKLNKAKKYLSEKDPLIHENYYGMAFLAFQKHDFVTAALDLLRGFLKQPYIAEIWLHQANSPVYGWNYPDNQGLFLKAKDFCLNLLGDSLWQKDSKFQAFCDWVYHHPETMALRAQALSFLNQPLYSPKRGEAMILKSFEEFGDFSAQIEPGIISKILHKIPHPSEITSQSPQVFEPYELQWAEHFREEKDSLDLNHTLTFLRGIQTNSNDEIYADCGDCEDCSAFEECANSTHDLEECETCEECEIEGFCHGVNKNKVDDDDDDFPPQIH
ncbi:MAG: hypothetical protein LBF22_05680 [Deltaproteobacteria bacterium]|jgi:hypothetical protein|nr:hypothetical protein [Deltaproteobacteria bacterium]